MKIILLLTGLVMLSSIIIQAQTINDRQVCFLKDFCLSNSNETIPWGTTFEEVDKYGTPEIICARRTNTRVLWDSVFITDSIKATFWTFYFRCFQKHKPTGKLTTVWGMIDSANIPTIKRILEENDNKSPTLFRTKHGYTYHWIIDNCNVNLGYSKKRGAFLDIQTKDKRFW